MLKKTAGEFDQFYEKEDPWGVQNADNLMRDLILEDIAQKYARGKDILELGCGEGWHAQKIFSTICRSITAIDFSHVAIERAKLRKIDNARFLVSDIKDIVLSSDYDAIVAIECIYYLSSEEQKVFFNKVKALKPGQFFIMSVPIIGITEHGNYYTHRELMSLFAEYNLTLIEYRNIGIYWPTNNIDKYFYKAIKAMSQWGFINHKTIQMLPTWSIYQRCYVLTPRNNAGGTKPVK